MGTIGKVDIASVIKEMDAKIDYSIELIIVGSVSGIIGYNASKITTDVDTYNSVSAQIIEDWKAACNKCGIQLSLVKTSTFFPPDSFENRLIQSDLSTAKIKIYYMEKHDFAISKISRGLGKDTEDIKRVHQNSQLDVDYLIQIFFDEFLWVNSTGSKQDHVISLKLTIEDVFGVDVLTSRKDAIDERFAQGR